jgi:CheY-like chemotaxis protein
MANQISRRHFLLGAGPNALELKFGQVITIGRSPDCDITLQDPQLSRIHLEIRNSGDEFSVSDLDSSNGTYVNDAQIQVKTLDDGDRVIIGSHVLEYIVREGKSAERLLRDYESVGIETSVSANLVHEEADGSMAGSLRKCPLLKIVGLLHDEKRSGRLELSSTGWNCRLWLRDGELIDGVFLGKHGEAALGKAFLQDGGVFTFQPDEGREIRKTTFRATTKDLLRELENTKLPSHKVAAPAPLPVPARIHAAEREEAQESEVNLETLQEFGDFSSLSAKQSPSQCLIIGVDSHAQLLKEAFSGRQYTYDYVSESTQATERYRAQFQSGRGYALVYIDMDTVRSGMTRLVGDIRKIEVDAGKGPKDQAGIMVVASARDQSAMQGALTNGADVFLIKPLTVDLFREKLAWLRL